MISCKSKLTRFLFFVITLAFIASPTLFSTNSLLWKISGKDMKKPSYLYGTFHLPYDKFFDVGDSVYIAIKNCDGFANEINLDSILIYSLTLNLASQDDSENDFDYNSIFSSEEIDKINKRLSQNSKMQLSNYKKLPPTYLMDALFDTKFMGPKRETFIDAHLYYIAKCLGKRIVGVEYYNEAASLLSEFKDYKGSIKSTIMKRMNDTAINDLVNDYVRQDVEKLRTFLDRSMDSAFLYKFIVNRNRIMVDRMIIQMNQSSMFFAVGAGHLGANDGIINLLREKGYKVEAVVKKNSSISKNFKVNSKNVNWYKHKNESMGFSVDFPQKPIERNELSLGTLVYLDLGTGIEYSAISGSMPETNKDKILIGLDLIVNTLKIKLPEVEEVSKKVIKDGDCIGYDIQLYSTDQSIKFKIYYKNEIVYMFITKTFILNKDHYDIDRFFKSIENIEIKSDTKESISNEIKQFEIEFPSKPDYSIFPIANSEQMENVETYMKSTEKGKIDLILFIYNIKKGYTYSTESVNRNVALAILDEKVHNSNYDSLDYYSNGLKGTIYTVVSKEDKMAFKILSLNTSNKIYVIIAQNKKDNSVETLDKFINSFKLNFRQDELKKYNYADCEFKLPKIPRLDSVVNISRIYNFTNKLESREISSSNDTLNGTSWLIVRDTYNPFYKFDSDSLLLFNMLDEYKSENDTILFTKYETVNGISTLSYKKRNLESNNFVDVGKFIFAGRKMYALSTTDLAISLENNGSMEIINSFRYNSTPENWKLSDDKMELLLKAFESDDTLKIKLASNAINNYKFDNSHLDRFFKLLLKKFYDDESIYSTKLKLLQVLSTIKNDRINKFLMENYSAIATSSKIEIKVCELLAENSNSETIKFILEKIKKIKNDSLEYYEFSNIFWNLRNNYSDLKEFIPQLFELLKDSTFASNTCSLINQAINTEKWESKLVQKYENQILDYCKSEYKKSLEIDTSSEYHFRNTYKVIDALELLISITTSNPSKELFDSLLVDEDNNLSMLASIALLKYNERVTDEFIEKKASNLENRAYLYGELKKINKLIRFPEKYKNQIAIAESELYSYFLNDEEFELDTIIYIDEKIINIDGKKSLYLLFKILLPEEDETMIGWTGPYPIEEDTNNLIVQSDHISYRYEKYERKIIERNFESWIKELIKEKSEEQKEEIED